MSVRSLAAHTCLVNLILDQTAIARAGALAAYRCIVWSSTPKLHHPSAINLQLSQTPGHDQCGSGMQCLMKCTEAMMLVGVLSSI